MMISKLTSYQACNENTEIRRYYITCQNVRSPPARETNTKRVLWKRLRTLHLRLLLWCLREVARALR